MVDLLDNSDATSTSPTLTIPEGSASAITTIGTVAVGGATNATISASWNGATKSALLTIYPTTLKLISIAPASIRGGLPVTGTVTLTIAAPTGGANVLLASNNAALTVPSVLTVPGGALSRSATFQSSAVAASTNVTVTATRNGITKTANVTLTVN